MEKAERAAKDLNKGIPGIGECGEREEAEEEESGQKQLIPLIAAGALFALGAVLRLSDRAELAVYLVCYLLAGGSVLLRAIRGIRKGEVFTEYFLMSLAAIGAFLTGQYAEGAAVLLFYRVGEMLEDRAEDHSKKSISALMDIRPEYANLQKDGAIVRVSPAEAQVGDILVVRPGEKVPLDGIVLDGISANDTSALTGESVPREIRPGDEILSGFINLSGTLTVKVTKEFGESAVSRILALVRSAVERKAPAERLIAKFAKYYTPAVVAGAVLLALLPPLLLPGAIFSDWIYRALIFLVISCPCALVISVPLGYFGGIGSASRQGILIKGGNYLDALSRAKTVVFDKTGTLTKGVFEVVSIHPKNGFDQDALLRYAALAESGSSHPIARSIQKAYGREIDPADVRSTRETAGEGVLSAADGKEILAGSLRLMISHQIACEDPGNVPGTSVHVAVGKLYAGCLIIADRVKEDSARAIQNLKALGVKKTVLLSGDSAAAAQKAGKELGLDEIHSDLLPGGKVTQIERLKTALSSRETLVFVGDGINDAPVLARADVGIAMGGLGSDAAIEAADVVIMTDEPSKAAAAIRIAKRTKRIVIENVVLALGVKAVFLALGAFGFATMWQAVFADTGVTLLAVFNALRALRGPRTV